LQIFILKSFFYAEKIFTANLLLIRRLFNSIFPAPLKTAYGAARNTRIAGALLP